MFSNIKYINAKKKEYDIEFIRLLIGNLIELLYHIHSVGIHHRDFGVQNIIWIGENFKLIDYGLSCNSKTNDSDLGSNDVKLLTSNIGSLALYNQHVRLYTFHSFDDKFVIFGTIWDDVRATKLANIFVDDISLEDIISIYN